MVIVVIEKVIIIGAPRSGTNILRDSLTNFDNVATWPCDEINYIWRHKNCFYKSDEFPVELATEPVRRYVQSQFNWVARRFSPKYVVEKTCANSLRVPFVNEIVPDSRFILIYRDGLDVVGSAMDRWTSGLEIAYLFKKLRFVPLFDIPVYAARYGWSHMFRVLSSESRLAVWGPRWRDMESVLRKRPLDEVVAIQWQRCLEESYSSLCKMPSDRWISVKYEKLTADPICEMRKILNFLGIDADDDALVRATRDVRSSSVGKGREALSPETVSRLQLLIGETLQKFGY